MARDRLGGKKTLNVGAFLDEFEKDDIKRKVNIVRLFGHFGITLEKKGKNWIGKCPWHDDKTPSLSVDEEKGLYNCFGCGEAGDHFSLVMKMKSLDFKGALSFLKSFSGGIAAAQPETIAKKKDQAGEKPPGPGKTKQAVDAEQPKAALTGISLDTVCDFYHKKLYENRPAMAYLTETRKIPHELVRRFRIGYADGSLLKIISNGQKETFKTLGILKSTDKGRVLEFFKGCIVFPLFDEAGRTVHLYGRKTDPAAEVAHLYLSGSHRGIFNRRASKVYDGIILTESIIDALSLISLGIENVQAIYGAGTLTAEHIETLKDDRVKTIILALDNDPAGKAGTEKHRTALLEEGFSVKVIKPPAVKDWNDCLKAGTTKEEVVKLIDKAEVTGPVDEKNNGAFSRIEKHLNTYTFEAGRITYRVIGVKDLFVSSLRVAVRAQCENERFCDTVDLYSARSRKNYSTGLAEEMKGIEPARVQSDLNNMLDYLEEERNRRFDERKKEERIEMTGGEVKAGMKLLQNPDMVDEVLDDFVTLGYVGENENKLLVFFASVSRLLPDPLNVYIQAGSSSGKSYLLEVLMEMLPEECLIDSSSFSDKAMYYCDDDYFIGKAFVLGESIHDEGIEGQIRQMQSEKKISRMVTLKDESGMMRTSLIKKKVRSAFMSTSTALYLNTENASRCLILHVDESKEQTTKVLERQREAETPGFQVKSAYLTDMVKRKHHAAQRLLKEVLVVNPYARFISFPAHRPAMRRSQKHFLNLNNAVCTARQMQKEETVITNPYTGEKMKAIACDIEDYRTAYRLYTKGVLLANRSDLPASCISLYENIRHMVKKEAEKQGVEPCTLQFIQRQVRSLTGLGPDSVKKYIKMLVDYEYLHITSGARQGTRYSYRLREDKPVEELDMKDIPAPEEMEEMIDEAGKSGETGENQYNSLF